jgi:hypothetical protein
MPSSDLAQRLEAVGTDLFGKPTQRLKRALYFKNPAGGVIIVDIRDGSWRALIDGRSGTDEAGLAAYAKRLAKNI